jgi:hypothetical protein
MSQAMSLEDVTVNKSYTLGRPNAAVVREAARLLRQREAQMATLARPLVRDSQRRATPVSAAIRPTEPMS